MNRTYVAWYWKDWVKCSIPIHSSFPCSYFSPVECERKEKKDLSSPSDYWSSPVDEKGEFFAALSGQPKQKMVVHVDNSPLQAALDELDPMRGVQIQFATANSAIHTSMIDAYRMLLASLKQLLAKALEYLQSHISASCHSEPPIVSTPQHEHHESTIASLYCAPIIHKSFFLKRMLFYLCFSFRLAYN